MTLTAGMLREDALRARGDGFELAVHLPWYRSLQLSCVEDVVLEVDGHAIAPDAIRFGIDGQSWALSELPDEYERFWFVQDAAALRVQTGQRTTPGDQLTVSVQLDLRLPYILIGPEQALVTSSQIERTLVAQ